MLQGGDYWRQLLDFGLSIKKLSPKEIATLQACTAIPAKVPQEWQCVEAMKIADKLEQFYPKPNPASQGLRKREGQQFLQQFRNLPSKQRRDSIANLYILLGAIALEKVVVRESLQPGSLAHRQAPALQRVGMDKVMAIL
jgi:hypothetical protein